MGDSGDDELLAAREALAAIRLRLAALGESGLPDTADAEWALLAIEGDALALAVLAQSLRASRPTQRLQGSFAGGLSRWRRTPGTA